MDAIYLLVTIALFLVIVGLAVFFWAVKSDQFDDLEGPAHSILFDDNPKSSNKICKKQTPVAHHQGTETPAETNRRDP